MPDPKTALAERRVDQLPADAQHDAVNMLEVISRAAADPNTDVAKLERLMAMAERLEAKRASQIFDEAMGEAQKEMGPVRTDLANKQTNSRYASYAALDQVIRPIYTKHGFSISYDTGDAPGPETIRVLAYVAHRAGERRTYKIDMPADGKGAKGGDVMTKTHATGSGFTYGQRYLVKGIFNLVVSDSDDDGNAAGGNGAIDDDQLETLTRLMTDFDADIPKFCKYFKIKSVPELPASKYRQAVEMLNTKGKQK